MSWTSFFTRRREQKASAAAPLTVQYQPGQPRLTPRQYDRLADEGYRKNVIAYRCIRLIAQNAASAPFALYRGRGRDRGRVESHPVLDLLRQPNPMQGGAEFFESVYGYYLIAGNSYIEALRGMGRPPTELWSLRPDRMRVIPGATGMIEGYRYQVGSRSADFPANPLDGKSDILHIKSFHPLDDWYGMSPLEAAAVSIDQHNDAALWNASLLQSSGRPSGALIYKPSHPDAEAHLTDAQRQNLKSELEHFFSGKDNAGRPLVLEGGLDWREMSMSPKDMDFLAGKDVSAREIALAFHVPPQLIGIEGSLSFANFEQARLALYDDAVLPLLRHVADELNHWLLPMFGEEDLHLALDLDAIEALSPRRAEAWARISAADFMTAEEKRQMLGLAKNEKAVTP